MPNEGRDYITRRVTFDEVLQYLSGRGVVPSATGSQLERMKDGAYGGGNARVDFEKKMLKNAGIILCVDALCAYASIRFIDCDNVRRFAERAQLGDGAAVVGILMAYQEWATKSTERGLANVYAYMRNRCPGLPTATDDGDEEDVAQSFRTGKAKRARAKAATLLADSELVLDAWVQTWNRKQGRHGTPRSAA